MAASGTDFLGLREQLSSDERLVGDSVRRLVDEKVLPVIGEQPRHATIDVALSNSFGFGGQNVCLALGHPGGRK